MTELIILALILGLILGLLLATSLLWLVRVKCPQCKQLRPLSQIILFHWKERRISGQPCSQCQRPKPQIDIAL